MKSWTIGKRITLGYAAVILIITILCGVTVYQLRQIERYSHLNDETYEAEILMETMVSHVRAIETCFYQHLMSSSPEEMKELVQVIQKLRDENGVSGQRYEHMLETSATDYKEQKAIRKDVWQARLDYNATMDKFLDLSWKSTTPEAVAALYTKSRAELDPVTDKYVELLSSLQQIVRKDSDRASRNMSSYLLQTEAGTWVGTGLTLTVGLLLAGFTIWSINKLLILLASNLGDASAQVSSAASQVAAASQSLAEGANEQAASLEETSASLEEINAQANRNGERADNARELADEARLATEQGNRRMENMVVAMNDIKAASDNIAAIVKTIDEIAFQTNMLSLNAAVEAARAGEAGAGFAVVADEVRALARRAAEAARETTDKIEHTISKSAAGVQLSQQVATDLRAIINKTAQVNELVLEISGSSREQSQGIGQITTAVMQMDRVTQSNASNAEETASSAQELNAQGMTLLQEVDRLQGIIGRNRFRSAPKKTVKKPLAGHHKPQLHAAKPVSKPLARHPREEAEPEIELEFVERN